MILVDQLRDKQNFAACNFLHPMKQMLLHLAGSLYNFDFTAACLFVLPSKPAKSASFIPGTTI